MPRAVLLALGISTAVYLVVGFIAVGVAGAGALKASDSPLAEAMKIAGSLAVSNVVAVGALVATATVLLTTALGVSRVVYEMARRDELPRFFGQLHGKYGTPSQAVWISGALMILLVLFIDLTRVVAISTFALLFYYAIANVSALRLKSAEKRLPCAIPIIGAVSCVALLVFSSIKTPSVFIAGLVSLLVGVGYYAVRRRVERSGK